MVSFGSKIPARENWWLHLDRVMMAGNSQKLSNWVPCCCCCCWCWRVKTFSSSKERKIKAQTCPNLPLLTLSILNIPTHKYTNTGCLECSTGSQMTHRFLSYLDEGADAPWHNEGGFVVCSHFFFLCKDTDTHTLTDCLGPPLSGLKLHVMTTSSGLMGDELSKVHLRRTSVPLTASTSSDVYIRIPLTCSMPATCEHKLQQQN